MFFSFCEPSSGEGEEEEEVVSLSLSPSLSLGLRLSFSIGLAAFLMSRIEQRSCSSLARRGWENRQNKSQKHRKGREGSEGPELSPSFRGFLSSLHPIIPTRSRPCLHHHNPSRRPLTA